MTLTASEVRDTFLDFFRSHHHKIVRSAPVIPFEDPTLLFTNAGMNQFKNIFLGAEKPEWTRIADTQKCIRVSGKHNDLEEVGKDTYHHTFFEMLGNWSFGDYYKPEAIQWAWELLTEVWRLPKEKLWATVYKNDDEAEQIWRTKTDVVPAQILRFDEKENFWEMGETGPCGPCSEIHIDLGAGRCDKLHLPGHVCQVNGNCARYIELWNLVFIQYNRDEDGKLATLPAKHVDTGMGFERIVAVLQGKNSNYDTDVFTPLIRALDDLSGVAYVGYDGMAHRVIADHVRALSFAITDGALPANEGRGYVLRRLLRRAARYGRTLNLHDPFIYKLVPVLADTMGKAFPELMEKNQYVAMVVKAEEEGFNNTLDRGIEIFEQEAQNLIRKGEKIFPGFAVFQLYDTFGFPVDLTCLMAEEKKLKVDIAGFDSAMAEQRRRAKDAKQARFEVREFFDDGKEIKNSEFVGYTDLHTKVKVVAFLDNEFLLDKTPFYGESGGQIGDQGVVYNSNGSFEVRVVDTIKSGNRIVHIGELLKGRFEEVIGTELLTVVDEKRRKATARNHTSTHLLHKALKTVIGDHVNQAGSLVTPERLRFDLTHFEKISEPQLDRIEEIVNEHVRYNHPVKVLLRSFDEAKKLGAVALFGEKYGDEVRVIQIDDYSMELCGGTHLTATGEIGYFRIVAESGVAAGVRRIEAVTGEAADQLLRQEKREIATVRSLLGGPEEELVGKIENLLAERKHQAKDISELRFKLAMQQLAPTLQNAETLDGIKLVAVQVAADSIDEMKLLGDYVRGRLQSGVGVLGAVIGAKPFLLCVVTDDLIKARNLKAGDIIKQLARYIDGGGGGKPHMAQAGGKDAEKLGTALQMAKSTIETFIETLKK